MAWQVEEADCCVLEWYANETDEELRDYVLDWIAGDWADDPEAQAAMPVPGASGPVYVTIVPDTNVGIKFLAATQFRVLRILKVRVIDDL